MAHYSKKNVEAVDKKKRDSKLMNAPSEKMWGCFAAGWEVLLLNLHFTSRLRLFLKTMGLFAGRDFDLTFLEVRFMAPL